MLISICGLRQQKNCSSKLTFIRYIIGCFEIFRLKKKIYNSKASVNFKYFNFLIKVLSFLHSIVIYRYV